IAIVLAIWAINSEKEATRQKKKAIEQQVIAENKEKEAVEQKARAQESEKIAREQKRKAEENEKEAVEQRAEADKQKILAEKSEKIAKIEETKAKENAVLEKIQGLIVDMNKEEANYRHYLTKAKELAVQSRSITSTGDNELKASLALTAFRLDEEAYTYLEGKTRTLVQGFDKNQLKPFLEKKEIREKYNDALKLYERMQDMAQKKILPAEIFAALREAYIAGEESKDIIYENVESWALAADGENNIIFNNREGELLTAPLQTAGQKLPVINKNGTVRLSGAPGAILQAAAFAGKYDDDRLFCGTVDGNLVYWQKNKWEKRTLPAKYTSKILAMAFSKNKNALFYSVKNTIYIYRLTADQMPEPIISAD
ncbi:MAG: hypothetical protein L0Y73_08395, partial [Candidatus Aminicenantes bacterium]|nr:hypothetical protein [Candidatus Aminicenantes bacterium]